MTKPDQQGYLGHLVDKSKEELIDLLKRQEILVKNQKFTHRLPDKGEKIHNMITRLNKLIAERGSIDDTADQFEKMALDAESARRQRTKQCDDDEEEAALLRQIINRGGTGKVYANEAQSHDSLGDNYSESGTFVNAYDKVIKKVDTAKPKPRYLPNRSIHASNVHQLVERVGSLSVISGGKSLTPVNLTVKKTPERTNSKEHTQPQHVLVSCNPQGGTTVSAHCVEDPRGGITAQTETILEKPGVKCRYDELLESAMPKSRPRYETAKMISLTDVMQLQLAQQRKHAEAQARHAAERLTHAVHLGLSSFDPEGASGSATRYREIRDEMDSDTDDDSESPD